MKAIVTVIGKDQVGIIANVCSLLSSHQVNVLDISQTVLQEYFTMVMLVDVSKSAIPFGEVADQMAALGQKMGMDIRAQREDTFQAMHRI